MLQKNRLKNLLPQTPELTDITLYKDKGRRATAKGFSFIVNAVYHKGEASFVTGFIIEEHKTPIYISLPLHLVKIEGTAS